MTKKELINEVASATGQSMQVCKEITDALFSLIKSNVSKGETLQLHGFGTFSKRTHSPRTARNPRTGEVFTVQAHDRAHFKPTSSFLEA